MRLLQLYLYSCGNSKDTLAGEKGKDDRTKNVIKCDKKVIWDPF